MSDMKGLYVTLTANIGGYVSGMSAASASTTRFGSAVTGSVGKLEQLEKTHAKGMATIRAGAVIAGVAMAGVGLAAVRAFTEFDKQMSVVKANVDDKGVASMRRLSDAALDAGKSTVFSATQAAEAETELAKAGLSAADITGGALKGAMDLASAGQIDLGRSAEVAATAMTQFNLSAGEVPHVADLLAAGADKALGGVDELSNALSYVGVPAHQFGVSIEETVGTLALFAQNGTLGSKAGTSMRQMFVRLAKPTKQSADLMKSLGIQTFDANGKFVGMAGLAGVLHGKLANLTDETRQSALATIFGSQALSTANVLYQVGAKGVQEWTDKVNDQGFAAKQAATKLDNLSGDLTKFKSAINVALIQSGSGANGALRALTQGATGAVSAFSNMPVPLQEAGAGLATVGGSGLLAFAAIGTLLPRIKAGRDALSSMGKAGSAANAGIGKLGKVLGVAGAVFIGVEAVTAGVRKLQDQLVGSQPSVEDFAKSVITLGKQGKASGALVDAFGSDMGKFNDELARLTDKSFLNKLSDSLDGLFGLQPKSLREATDDFKSLDDTLAGLVQSGNADTAAAAFASLAAHAMASGMSVDQLKKALPGYEDALAGVDNKQKLAEPSADKFGNTLSDVAAAGGDASDAIGEYKSNLDSLNGVNISAAQSQLDVRDALRDVTKSFRENGSAIDSSTVSTEAAKVAADANMDTLLQYADKVQAAASAEVQRTGDITAGNAILQKNRGEIAAAMRATGMHEAAIQSFLDTYLKVPTTTRNAPIAAPGATAARSQVDGLTRSIKRVPPAWDTKVSVTGTGDAEREVYGLGRSIQLQPHEWTIRVRTVGFAAAAQQLQSQIKAARYLGSARGNIVYNKAAGGYLPSQAVIAPPHTLFQWAEPETGGEAFVPRRGDRKRSRAILTEAARWYGGDVAWTGPVRSYAAGGVAAAPSRLVERYSASSVTAQGASAGPFRDLIVQTQQPRASAKEIVEEAFYEARRVVRSGGRR